MTDENQPVAPTINRVLIVIEGGMVSEVFVDAEAEVYVLDMDSDDEEHSSYAPAYGGTLAPADKVTVSASTTRRAARTWSLT